MSLLYGDDTKNSIGIYTYFEIKTINHKIVVEAKRIR